MQNQHSVKSVTDVSIVETDEMIETHQHYTEYDSRSIPNLAALLRSSRTIVYSFANGNKLIARSISAQDSSIKIHHYEVSFGYFRDSELMQYTNSEYFATDDAVSAAAAFVFRVNDVEPALTTSLGKTLQQISAAHDANEPLRMAKNYLRTALLNAYNMGVEGLGRANSLQDMISRLNAMEQISSLRK